MKHQPKNTKPEEFRRSFFDHAALRITFYVVTVLTLANLGAVVDYALRDDIPYFDEEHLIVGGITGLVTALLFGIVAVYTLQMEKTVKKQMAATETALENEKKYRDLFEETGDVVFVIGAEGKIIDINPAGAIVFGYPTRNEFLYENFRDIFLDRNDWNDLRMTLRQLGYVEGHEVHMKRKDGTEVIVSMSARRVKDPVSKEMVYRGMMRDVTYEKRVTQQLIQSQKMESIGRLAGGVAHDFNNYLTTIQGYTDLALMELPDDSLAKSNMQEARKAAEAASELTSQLILFSRHQPMVLRTIDLNHVAKGLKSMMDRLVGEETRIKLNLAPDLMSAKADAGNLAQVIVNLVVGANANMPGGGEITITTCNGKVDAAYLEAHPEARRGEYATISVTDSGAGLTESELAHVFEPFARTDSGAGMGLSMVYGIVMQHDGWIDVDSIPGMGTTFTVFLPGAEHSAEEDVFEAEEACELSCDGQRILLVEDDDAVREITCKILRESGYEVIGAHDAAEAFARFASEHGDIQLVFSDVVLPGEDGIHLVENLREHKPELAVLLASGYSDTAVDWQTVQSRGYRFMQKPYVMPDLLRTIRELLLAAA